MGGSVFGIKEALRTLSLVYETSVVSSPGHKTMEIFIQPLLISTFVVRVTKHEIISILKQSAVTGCEGVSVQGGVLLVQVFLS